MAILTIRKLDDALKTQLRVVAAQHGNSMEQEVREILYKALIQPVATRGMGTRLHNQFKKLSGGIELSLPDRKLSRQPPIFVD